MADHTEYVELANELINEEGRLVTLQLLSAEPVDPEKPWQGETVPVVKQFKTQKAVFLPASGTNFSSMSVSEAMLAKVEQVALFAFDGVELDKMNLLVDGAVSYRVEWVSTLKPADQICLYAIGVCQ